MTKTASIARFSAAGTPVLYDYLVTNTGNVALSSVAVTDPQVGLSPVTCPQSTLAVGANEVCTATYTTTQADVDNGKIVNLGTASGTPPTGSPVTATSSLRIPATQKSAIDITKTASIDSFSAPGTPITYTYVVTNTGTVTQFNVTVSDAMPGLSAIDCSPVTLAPGASETCTADYTTTQADVDAGGVANSGVAVGHPAVGPAASDSSTVEVAADQIPEIAVDKSSSVTNFSATGTSIQYDYLVANTGNVTLSGVGVADPMPGLGPISCASSELAPGASETCTASYVTTQADLNDPAGITNTGTATGQPPFGPPVTSAASLTIASDQYPGIAVHKSADTASFSAPGVPIRYSYAVTNTGNVTLTSVGVTDPQPGLSPVSCGQPSLAPAASETCTATYTTTQADVDAGGITNTGTASGTSPADSVVTGSDDLTIPGIQTPAITVAKSADATSYSAPGTPIDYSYVVSNTGNVTLTSVGVTDPQPGLSPVSCAQPTLAPAASETCTATYTTTQADVDAGGITNTGTATATAPGGGQVTGSDDLTIPAVQHPAITVAKSADATGYSAPGTTIHYSYLVSNTGNVTLASVDVTDPQANLSAVSCPEATLSPGSAETCSATYTTTQADVDAGSIANTGTATAIPPSGPGVTSSDSLTIPAVQNPSVGIVKSASLTSFAVAASPVTYSYLVTNTGNVTLTSVGVSDPQPGLSPITCGASTLAPGDSETCTASYTTTQADVDNGSITNVGTASGVPPSGPPVTASDTLTVPAIQSPSIGILKTASVPNYSAAGTAITYSYYLTNSGNTTLNHVGVNDTHPGVSPVSCPLATLAPAGTETCTASYTTTQSNVDFGRVTNFATAYGTPPHGSQVSQLTFLTLHAIRTPGITVVKSANSSGFSSAGTPITYSYDVTNSGNVTLHDIGVTDPQPGLSPVTCGVSTLGPAASETCTATYTTTQGDVDAGGITNTGTASGTTVNGSPVSATSSLTIPASQSPDIGLVKSADVTSYSAPGTLVDYSYVVTNTGNVTLGSVNVFDGMSGLQGGPSCPQPTLAPGASETCTANYTTTQSDVDNGSVANTGTVTGQPELGSAVSASDALTIPASQNVGLSVTKTASIGTFSGPGVPITYSYLVNNTGNVTLHSVHVSDPQPGLSAVTCPTATLGPPDTETCTATYSTTQADVDAGGITNTGTASGTSPGGHTVTASDTLSVPSADSPSISVHKYADAGTYSGPGAPIHYSYLVTNTGDKTLSSVGVTDPQPGLSAVNCGQSTLAPGAYEICTATYATTQADVDNGSITNTGTAAGTPPTGHRVTGSASLTIVATQNPSLTVVKSASVTSYRAAGTAITYSYLVTDTGNVTFTSVSVSDPQGGLSAVSCPSGSVAPGGSETCTATYTTTQADVDSGSITNTGTARGAMPNLSTVTGSDSLTVPATQTPSVSLTKSASVSSYSGPGAPITYSYTVTNGGNVTLNSVQVTDPMAGLSPLTCPPAPLAPAAHETCTASYLTTVADVTTGHVSNTGTVKAAPPSGPDVTASASLSIPFTAPACYVGPWPTAVDGYSLPLVRGPVTSPTGVSIGEEDGSWVLLTHGTSNPSLYGGTITTTGTFTGVSILLPEKGDTIDLVNSHTITIKFKTYAGLDGVQFTTSCGSSVSFALTLKRKAIPASKFYLGASRSTPGSSTNPLVFARQY